MSIPALQPSRVHVGYAGHFWSTYQCVADEAHTPEDAQRAQYWAHIASLRTLRVNDVLEVRSETGQWHLDLVVYAATNKAVAVRVLREWISPDYAGSEDNRIELPESGIIVKYMGPAKKWAIIRASDRQTIKDGLNSKQDALREAGEYERLVA